MSLSLLIVYCFRFLNWINVIISRIIATSKSMAMAPPMIPPAMTDVMLLETENGTATRVSCVVAIDVLVSVLACVVVAVARDVTETHVQLQSVVIGSSGIGCVVTVAAVVDGTVVESGQESAPSSVHIIIYCLSCISS